MEPAKRWSPLKRTVPSPSTSSRKQTEPLVCPGVWTAVNVMPAPETFSPSSRPSTSSGGRRSRPSASRNWPKPPLVPTGSSSMWRSASWMWTGTDSSWACTTSLTPPTWSTWPWVLSRATRRRPCSCSRDRMVAGSGGASISTHSPPGPSGATTHALVAAIHSGSPSISMPARLYGPAHDLRQATGPGVGLELLERDGQGDRPVRPLPRRTGHVGALLHAESVVEGGGDEHRRRPGQAGVDGGHDVVDGRGLVEPQRPAQALAHRRPRRLRRLEPEASLGPEVGARPEARHRGQVVGGDGGHRLNRVHLGRVLLEPQQPVGEQP